MVDAGDVNGDGVPDLVMRVRGENGEPDRILIFMGKTPPSQS